MFLHRRHHIFLCATDEFLNVFFWNDNVFRRKLLESSVWCSDSSALQYFSSILARTVYYLFRFSAWQKIQGAQPCFSHMSPSVVSSPELQLKFNCQEIPRRVWGCLPRRRFSPHPAAYFSGPLKQRITYVETNKGHCRSYWCANSTSRRDYAPRASPVSRSIFFFEGGTQNSLHESIIWGLSL